MPTDSNILRLAETIKRLSEQIVEHYTNSQVQEPSFDASSAEVPSDPKYATLRVDLNDAASDLLRLVNGPKAHFRTVTCSHGDLAVLQVAFELDLFVKVPVDTTIDTKSLAEVVGIDEDRLYRIMRFLVTQRTFAEPEPGVFGHNSQSILFTKEPYLAQAAHYQFPQDSDQAHSPFAERFGVPLFKYYQQRPAAAARFAQAMAGIVKLDRQVGSLKDGYPWHRLDGKLVDIGGGSGHVSMFLASHFPNLNVVVQDRSPDMLAQGKAMDLSALEGRIEFMQHDFFTPEPVKSAACYLIRQVLHNWNDRDCIRILRGLVPALEQCAPRTPLLINDTVIPKPDSVTLYEEHGLRQMDIMMLIALGAKQRTEAEFRRLLHQADPRLQLVAIHGEASMAVLEVHLSRV